MSTIAVTLVALPVANAHTPPWQIPTWAYVNVAPNPVGVGQRTLVIMWLTNIFSPETTLGNDYRFHNYKLTITAPDGKTTTQTFDVVSDPTSAQTYSFAPSQVGTYTVNFTFPGQDFNTYSHPTVSIPLFGPPIPQPELLVNDTYLPSSASTTLTVQQEAIPSISSYPLPSEYWTRPIYGENSGWWSISSNWLGSGAPVLASVGSGDIGAYGANNLFSGAALNRYPGDAVGPQTSHVMWTKPLQAGGIVGGNDFAIQGDSYFEGSAYVQRYDNPIIMDGILYYQAPLGYSSGQGGGTFAVDLQTGKQLWQTNAIPSGALSFGYIYDSQQPNQKGVMQPILFTSNFAQAYDAYTGKPLFNVTGVPSGTTVMGPSGEQLRYVFANAGTTANPQWYLAQWNSSKLWLYDINPYTGGGSLSPSVINASNGALIQQLPIPITGESGTLPSGAPISVPYGSSLTLNANIDFAAGLAASRANPTTTYDWNISTPFANTMPTQPPSPFGPSAPFSIVAANYGDIMLCRNGSLPTGFAATGTGTAQGPYTYFAVNLNASKGEIGSIKWMQTYNPPAGNITVNSQPVDFQTRVFTFSYGELMQWVGYSLDTGNMLWGPTPSQKSFDYYGYPGTVSLPGVIAYGNLYTSSFSGICYAYNDLTGKILWTYGNGGEGNSTYGGLQVFYGDYPTQIQAIANGVVYLATNEHTMPNPFYKGCVATAINATTGQEIWKLSEYPSEWSSPGSAWATADGFTTFMNGLDNNIYSIGRGSSATAVQAPQTAITAGNNVVIQGTVMDTSAGTKQNQQAADFPNGVPCSSDVSMKDWMGYVYQQKPEPTNFTGVPVSINAIDPNGNYIHIGDATSNGNGLFYYTWTAPNIPGNYLVTATFAGTNGYWPSNAQTAMNVQEAPSASAQPTLAPASMADLYFLPVSIAIILAIVIVGAVLALLMLRKRPQSFKP